MWRSGIAAAEFCKSVTSCCSERAKRKALIPAHTSMRTLAISQRWGADENPANARNSSAIATRRKTEKKKPRLTGRPSRLGLRRLRDFEAIASATHGLQIARSLGVGLNLLANAANIDVNRTRCDEACVTPYCVQKMITTKDSARVPGEIIQKPELG